jgi:putative redox protein
MNTENKTLRTMQVDLQRVDNDFHFEALGTDKIPVHIDGAAAIGGHHQGARPMELILMGLGGCSAIDIILILRKQKQQIDDFKIEIIGAREANIEPSPFRKIHIRFILRGANLKLEKAQRAADLSMQKYCSVAAMLTATAELTWEVVLEMNEQTA